MRDNLRLDVMRDEDEDGLGAARGLLNALGGTLVLVLLGAVVWVVLAVF